MPEDNVEETVVPVEEIDDMLGLEPAAPATPATPADGTPEAPAGEASATGEGTPPEALAEAPAADEPPAAEAPAATVPVVSTPAPQAPPTPAQETELQIAQKQNEQLRLQLNELAKMGLTIPLPTAQTSPTQGVQPIVPVTPPAIPVTPPVAPMAPQPTGSLQDIITKLNSDQNYLTEEDLDNIVDNPSLINVAINKAVRGSTEQLIQAIPLIAAGIANQQIVLNNMAIDFYETNSDLAPYKEFVSAIAKQVEASNTGKTYNEIFNLTATQVRERLGLKVTSPQTPSPSGITPAFAGTRGPARPPAASKPTDDMATQIAELLL